MKNFAIVVIIIGALATGGFAQSSLFDTIRSTPATLMPEP